MLFILTAATAQCGGGYLMTNIAGDHSLPDTIATTAGAKHGALAAWHWQHSPILVAKYFMSPCTKHP